jgi:hypothetical protein
VTTAGSWFDSVEELRTLLGDAALGAAGNERAEQFTAEMRATAAQDGLHAALSRKQLEWLCRLADWEVPSERG